VGGLRADPENTPVVLESTLNNELIRGSAEFGKAAGCDVSQARRPSAAETVNGQQCRRHKALMRHTAANCFSSTRVALRLNRFKKFS
jgi:hypothetical protein